MISAATDLQKRIVLVDTGIQQLREPTRTSSVSSDEARILDALSKSKVAANLVRVRQEFEDLSEDEFWSFATQSLEKQLIEMTMKAF
ncbi:MAG: hypothetical protein IPK19_15240 [Chloroflexi bacterium]|nr:hypothetical protein [Chloroflexota bacterium]